MTASTGDRQATQIVVDLGSEWAGEDGGTLAGVIVDRAASKLLAAAGKDMASLRARIETIRDEEIREQVRPAVAEAFGETVQRFNEYGSPQGPAITLRDLIIEKGMAQFKVRTGFASHNRSPLESFIEEEIHRVFRAELQKAMKDARAKVLAAVREQGAAVVQETIERMART